MMVWDNSRKRRCSSAVSAIVLRRGIIPALSTPGRLGATQAKCHLLHAKGNLTDDTAEDSCENDVCVTAKYAPATANLVGCPSCLNFTTLANNTLAKSDPNAGFV